MKKRVVVSGIGVISPIGTGKEAYWNALRAGTCGVDKITHFDAEKFTTQIAAEVKDFEPADYMDKKKQKEWIVLHSSQLLQLG